MPRGFLRVGGLTVARQQVDLAISLNCERVIVIASGLSPEIIDLQHRIEATGRNFHLLGRGRDLVGLVSAIDEVFVIADGLFVSGSVAANLLDEGQCVLVQPIDQGLAAGFERIDLNLAFGGAMRIPGRLIERMADLPPDCDATSSLLRIALQAGIRQKHIPVHGQDGAFWTLVRGESEAHALEPQWIRSRTHVDGMLSPSSAIALVAARSIGPALLHSGGGARMLVIAGFVLAALALVAGWFGFIASGLIFASLGWFTRETATLLGRIETESSRERGLLDGRELYGWLIDAAIVVLTAWGTELHAGQHFIDRLFPPFMLLAVLRILPRLFSGKWTSWLGDRALISLGLAGAITAGVGSEAVHLLAAAAAFVGIALPLGKSRLTRP